MNLYAEKSKRVTRLEQVVAQRQRDMVVVVEDVHDPHNAAAIARTCEGFGIQHFHIIFEHEPPFNPKKVGKGSSSSANKWLTFHAWRSTEECFMSLKEQGYTLMGTALHERSVDVYEVRWPEKIAVVFGNEHGGLSAYACAQCDQLVTIPMLGMVQSFNVSVSAGVVLGEIGRVRRMSGKDYSLSEGERALLLDDFLKR